MSHAAHRAAAAATAVRCAVITLSDTRTPATDDSGRLIQRLLADAGVDAEPTVLLPDEPAVLRDTLDDLLGRREIDAVLTNGGTGIARRDQTVQVVEDLLDVALPGFGELFRVLSWEQIGAGAMISRAVGGVARGKLVFAMPGSPNAVDLAMTRLILPELRHLTHELRR